MSRNCYIKCCFLASVFSTFYAEQWFRGESDLRNRLAGGSMSIRRTETDYENRRSLGRNMKFKYILHWTSKKAEPFFETSATPFKRANCSWRNCLVIKNRSHLKDIRNYDAIIFHGPDFWYNPSLLDDLPETRSSTQKYIFYSGESADYYPMCDIELNDFFNLTWTYKLKSDLPYPYFIVRDSEGTVIGPKQEMHWKKVEDMLPIGDDVKKKLQMKRFAVGWLASICSTASKREEFVQDLVGELSQYRLKVDTFGKCSESLYKCGRPELVLPDCWEMFQLEYYFYLSFENSFDEDYVTEKLLNPLQNYVVPIVYGAANYSRFLPEGSYLNARELGAVKLAKDINDIIEDKERYYSFFKWRNHYSFHSMYESPDTHPFCSLCEILNEGRGRKRTYPDFTNWWNIGGRCPTTSVPPPKDFLFI